MIENEVGYVYFVRMGTYVKIGHTMDVAARMKTIQTSCPAEIHLMTFLKDCTEPVEIPPPVVRKNFFDAVLSSPLVVQRS